MESAGDSSGLAEEASARMREDVPETTHEPTAQLDELRRLASVRIGEAIAGRPGAAYRLSAIKVLGTPNTRPGFLLDVVSPALRSGRAGSLASLLDQLVSVAEDLQAFGIFDKVSVELDGQPGAKDLLSATIRVKERSRFTARTGTDFGNQEGSAYVSASVRNCFGGAESFEANASFGTRTRTSYEIRMSTPVRARPDSALDALIFGATRQQLHCSHDEGVRGAQVKFRHLTASGLHEFGAQAVHRHLENVRPGAGLAVRLSGRSSVKHSVTHHYTLDRRDDRILPSTGYRIQSLTELASNALGGDAAFAKLEVSASMHASTSHTERGSLPYTFGASARAGAMRFLGQDPTTAYIHDRFGLGGPQTVRGFMLNGIGPRSGPDNIGGDSFWAVGLSVSRRLSSAIDWPIFGQCFLNAGALGLSSNHRWADAALLRPSASAGIGLAFRHPAARIEVSFCLPLLAGARDRSRKGLQFGIGLDFL